MKKLKVVFIVLLAVSLMAIVVYLGVMKDRDLLNRGTASPTADADDSSPDEDGSSSGTDRSPGSSPSSFTPAGIPEAPGTVVEENESAVIDYSNIAKGYVMVDFTEPTTNILKVTVEGPATSYTYNLEGDKWTTFPLSDGDGYYKVTVYESMGNQMYATVLAAEFDVALESEFAPFLHANQYVDYVDAKDTMAKTAELTAGTSDTLEKVGNIFEYVTENVTYDVEMARNMETGYLPDLDHVLAVKRGICFDYASLMTAMLRSCRIPCKLVVGYAGDAYHAWINVWTEESGWIDEVIRFDGETWTRMDPTFYSAGDGNGAAVQFIGDGSNYSPMYEY